MRGRGGADTVNGVGNLAALTALTVEGGADGDVLRGGNGADVLLGGGGDDHVDGNQGADVALLGGGKDRFQWDPGDGSDAVEGGSDADALDFNGSNIGEAVGVAPNGERVRFTRNIANIVMDLGGVEDVNFRALGGADTVTVDPLAGTDARTVDVDLTAAAGGGDAAADNVVVRGTDLDDRLRVEHDGAQLVVDRTRVAGGEPEDAVTVEALGGADEDHQRRGGLRAGGRRGERRRGSRQGDLRGRRRRRRDRGHRQRRSGAHERGRGRAAGQPHRGARRTRPRWRRHHLRRRQPRGAHRPDDGGRERTPTRCVAATAPTSCSAAAGTTTSMANQGADVALLGRRGVTWFQWDPGDASDTVEGGSGADALDFNGSNIGELIAVVPNGERVRLTRNIASIVMDLDSVEGRGTSAPSAAPTR